MFVVGEVKEVVVVVVGERSWDLVMMCGMFLSARGRGV